ncbi:hypothetical protein Tco_1101330, partial [Tanacetum coccineum]
IKTHLGISKEVGTPRYLSLVVPLTKVGDEAVHKELGDRMERAATTASSLEAEQDSVNLVIYTSCIEQFWATSKVQTVNGVRQLQALVDKKRVIVTESSIRRDLHLDDAEGEDAESYLLIHSNNTLLINHLHLPNPRRKNHLRRLRDRRQRFLKMRQSMRKVYQHLPMIHNLVGRSIEDIDANVDVSLVDETQERQDDDLMFDTGVLEDDEMHVEAKVDGKDEQSTKPDDSTAGEAVTTASVDDSVVPTTIEEITLAQTLIQIKAG